MPRHLRALSCLGLGLALFACLATPLLAQQPSERLAGRELEDAIRTFQAAGLRVVFTSQLVTRDMRVRSEPRARSSRARLVEVLAPHGLDVVDGPGGTLLVVPKRWPATPGGGAPSVVRDSRKTVDPPQYLERVTVTANADRGVVADGASEQRVQGGDLERLSGRVVDDPVRAIQALPGVAAGDDFRSEFSMRGSAYRHAGVFVEGVAVPWLQHGAPGRDDPGTLTMLRGELVEEAKLQVGAYARRRGGQLGPQLELTLREGARTDTRLRLGVSGATTTVTAEGPLGSAAVGSWLVGLRKSHVEWPLGRTDHEANVFGFGDLQAKFVVDVSPRHQASVAVVAGQSDVERDDPNPGAVGDGTNRAALVALTLRSTLAPDTMISQQLSSVSHEYRNRLQDGRSGSSGTDRAEGYRIDVLRALSGSLLDAGLQVRRIAGVRREFVAHRLLTTAG